MPKRGQYPRGVDRRPDGMFRARVSYDGVQYSIGSFFTLGDAKAALAIARSEIARRQFVPPAEVRRQRLDAARRDVLDAVTVAEWATRWLEGLANEGRSPGTLRSYQSTLNVHILPALGTKRLLDISPEEIELLLDAIPKKGARDNAARVMRSMFRAAVRDRSVGLLVSPVEVSISRPARRGVGIDSAEVATPAEVRAFAAGMPPALAIAVPLAAWAALRLGEVLGLQRRDFDDLEVPDRAALNVRRQWLTKASPPRYADPKAGSRRRVALPAEVAAEVARHLEEHVGADPTAPLLPSSRDPMTPVSQTAFDRAWRVARDAVRPGFRFHALRHTGLTAYARAGATLAELQARGGHRSAETALRYQHATAERDRALTDKLDADLRGEV